MAGISVPQYDIFKIGTTELKHSKWDFNITKEQGFRRNQIVSLFEAQEFRLISQILGVPISDIDFSKYLLIIVIDNPSDFDKALRKNGIKVNGITFKRFVGTTNGLKNNTLLFANAEILDELNERCNCGRRMDYEIIPAKLEAYKSLTCSASQPICDPNGIIVVSDCLVNIKEDIIKLDDSGDSEEPIMSILKDEPLENDASDGFSLCTIGYMERISECLGLNYVTNGVCLRNAWLKGMLYAFPILEFVEQYNNGNYIIKDIWGNDKDLRDAELILTESCLKLWKAYDSVEHYIEAYHKNGYSFAVTKISPQKLEDQREINYQYLQSYEFDDSDIEELCNPTVKYLKDALCGDYHSTLKFLGICDSSENNSWQQALRISPRMMEDPIIVDAVYRMIKKKIDDAKIGKLIVEGNYQIASGDPFSLMQHICGLPITGLLKAGEVYSSYWIEHNVDEILLFRSPMTSHNNIRRVRVNFDDRAKYWYQYMNNIMIVNSFDTICQSLNGMDYDSDLVMSTNNAVMLRKHRVTLPIVCIQRNVSKIVPTEEDIIRTNRNGMGNKVGTITNRVTAMMEVQSHFENGSREYKELEFRIASGQLYQQNELDKLKGIVAKPMPKYWYNYKTCDGDKFKQSICVAKKPYFMIYIYDDYRRDYRKYYREANQDVLSQLGMTLSQLLRKDHHSRAEKKFLEYYNSKIPFGIGKCAMNRICWYIEEQFNHYVHNLKISRNFDYNFLKKQVKCEKNHINNLKNLEKEYILINKNIKGYQYHDHDIDDQSMSKFQLKRYVQKVSVDLCPDADERTDILIDMRYQHNCNSQFFWDCVGVYIIQRLENLVYGDI